MGRSQLPATSLFHDSGFRFRRLGDSRTRFSISVRMPADDGHTSWWWSKPRRVELARANDKAELLALAEDYRQELTHADELAAARAEEDARNITVRELHHRYMLRREQRVAVGELSQETLDRDRTDYSRLVDRLGDTRLHDVTAHVLSDWLAGLSANGVSNYSRARAFAKAKTLLRYGVQSGYLDRNPAEDVPDEERPTTPRTSQAYKDETRITTAQADTMIARILAEPLDGLRVAMYLARYTGMRRGEVLALRWSDIDEGGSAPLLHVRRSLDRHRRTTTPKTYESARDIPLSQPTLFFLDGWKEQQRELFATLDKKWTQNTPIACNHVGELWSMGNFERSARVFFEKCGLGEFKERTEFDAQRHTKKGGKATYRCTRKSGYVGANMHALRHLYATELVAAGIDVKTAQRLLGHANVQTTLGIYAEAVEGNLAAAVATHDRLHGWEPDYDELPPDATDTEGHAPLV